MTDIHLNVTDTGGDGRPVVLLHGWPLSAQAWAENVPALVDAGYRVVAYDRRGFGSSDKPESGYDYDTLAADLDGVLTDLDLRDATLVGFSMGGGEVARYVANHGSERLRSVVFAAAVPPYLRQGPDNPDGPLDDASAESLAAGLAEDRAGFLDSFLTTFFSADGALVVSEDQRQGAVDVALQSGETAARECMNAWASTDFRGDLATLDLPTLVLHGDADALVPLEGSGRRTYEAVAGSELVVIEGGPHGVNVSHREQFDAALLDFLAR